MNTLYQLQLSTYSKNGIFDLACDSNWNIGIGRIKAILEMRPDWKFWVLVPNDVQVKTLPENLYKHTNVTYIRIPIQPNAIVTRYDFPYQIICEALRHHFDKDSIKIDLVFMNDPMLLKNYKTLFNMSLGYNPKFICNSHFIDNKANPKVKPEVSYWYTQVSAAEAADLNVYQCQSAMHIFESALLPDFNYFFIKRIMDKGKPWDDGYSQKEVSAPNTYEIKSCLPKNKTVVFFPNRISLYLDYTNSMRFIEAANKVYEQRQDFCVCFGNPGQKLSNDEICKMCKPAIKLFEGSTTREQYLALLPHVDINVGLYIDDSYGGCSWRELVSRGSLPLSPYVNSYKDFYDHTNYPFRVKEDLSDLEKQFNILLDYCNELPRDLRDTWNLSQKVVEVSSYESQAKTMVNDIEGLVNGR